MSARAATKICTPGSGMEFEGWAQTWCNRCLHDHDLHNHACNGPGCPLVTRAMLEEPDAPTVWQRYARHDDGTARGGVRCAAFEPCEPCGLPVDLRPPVYGDSPSAEVRDHG